MRHDVKVPPIHWKISQHTVLTWEGMHLKSPDPLAELRQNPQISKAALRHEEARLGLDKPYWVQYQLWIGHLFRFDWHALKTGNLLGVYQPDLGKSFSGEDVTHILATRIPNTLLLNAVVLLVSWGVAIPLGIYAALRFRTRIDTALTLFSSLGMAAPAFLIALLLAVVAVKLGWPPVGGITSEDFAQISFLHKVGDVALHLILPVIALTVGGLAGIQRQMRGNLLDVLEAEYVRTARAKGLPEDKVIYRHAVRTAINPLITLLGFEFAGLLSGAALVEMVLHFPGLGFTALEAVTKADTNLAMAVLLMGAVLLVLGNLFADILLKVFDPRIELA